MLEPGLNGFIAATIILIGVSENRQNAGTPGPNAHSNLITPALLRARHGRKYAARPSAGGAGAVQQATGTLKLCRPVRCRSWGAVWACVVAPLTSALQAKFGRQIRATFRGTGESVRGRSWLAWGRAGKVSRCGYIVAVAARGPCDSSRAPQGLLIHPSFEGKAGWLFYLCCRASRC
jgi:hypothetical protein